MSLLVKSTVMMLSVMEDMYVFGEPDQMKNRPGTKLCQTMSASCLPDAIVDLIYRRLHEICFIDVVRELLDRDWVTRRIELAFQAHARDGNIHVQQLVGGRVGQQIRLHPLDEGRDYGRQWPCYDREQRMRLQRWSVDHDPSITGISSTDQKYSDEFGTWRQETGQALVKVRLMIRALPAWIEDQSMDQQQLFWNRFPGFFPVEVIMPHKTVTRSKVPLNQHQLAIKYDFEEDVKFGRGIVDAMSDAKSSAEIRRQLM